ncbi:MAG TPA: lipopolysaccharide heptosyltransferase II, partial [Verrucomicrobiae bacterium]|nr:lipopolysaccharide heptosyltransferase II [Verrucomicrobiae bacterium]
MNAILVVGPAWVGDMVMAQSLFKRLKEKHPDAAIDVVAPGWSLPLIQRMPEVRAGIEMPLGHGRFGFGIRRTLGRSLRIGHYTQSIVLPGSWKSALVPWFANAARRTGYRGEMRYGLLNDIRPLDEKLLQTTVQRFVALAADPTKGDSPLAGTVPTPSLRVD